MHEMTITTDDLVAPYVNLSRRAETVARIEILFGIKTPGDTRNIVR